MGDFNKKMGLKIIIMLLMAFSCVSFINFSFAETTTSSSNFTAEDSLTCINESVKIIENMATLNFSIIRLNDSLNTARDYYNAQLALQKKGKKPDFLKVDSSCQEIVKVSRLGLDSKDQIQAFLIFYNNSILLGMNTSTIEQIINQMTLEMDSERYEQISGLVDKAYAELSNKRAEYTVLNVFYKNTTRGIKIFLVNNWKLLTGIILVLIIGFIFYRVRIAKWLIMRKITSLEIRKRTIKELIMQTKKDYFQTGKIPEGDYNIKTKKFAELIRDIDRQIPLLKEELIKIDKKLKKDSSNGTSRHV